MLKGRDLRHGRFFYHTTDMIGRMLDLFGEWSENELAFLLELVGDGDVVVDVGAHIGTFAIPFGRKVGPDGCVLAFEAQRLIFNNLVANVFVNQLNNIRANNIVCGSESFFLNLGETDASKLRNSGGFSIRTSARQERGWRSVRAEPLDLLLHGLAKLSLIKIDVEGYEAEVLTGAVETLKRLRPVVHCECLSEASMEFLRRLGADLDYRLYAASFEHFNPDNHFRRPKPPAAPEARDSNVLLWPAERRLPDRIRVTEVASFPELAAAPTPRWE